MGFVTATRRWGRGRLGAGEEAAGGAVIAAVGEGRSRGVFCVLRAQSGWWVVVLGWWMSRVGWPRSRPEA